MKEVTLKIPDDRLSFFMELFEQLGLEVADSVSVPDEQKEVVRERILSGVAEEFLPWDSAYAQLKSEKKAES